MRKKPIIKRKHKINDEITSLEVRLLSDSEPIVIKTSEAMKIARDDDKDLILINETQNPPIARIADYNKFIYDTEKAEREKKKNSVKSVIKEVQLSTNISDHDLQIKAKKALEFLSNGDKVKCVIQLKGRQKANPDRGQLVMLKFASIVEEIGIPENLPKLEGHKWFMMMKPKKK
jgi:translation initiation factor IF-3